MPRESRSEPEATTRETVERFNAAFNAHDVEAVMALMSPDCLFENTAPPPDGERFEGQKAVRAYWERFFAAAPTARFETEELVTCGDRAVVRWRYTWDHADPRGHVRGIDLFLVRNGLVAEKRSYVKG